MLRRHFRSLVHTLLHLMAHRALSSLHLRVSPSLLLLQIQHIQPDKDGRYPHCQRHDDADSLANGEAAPSTAVVWLRLAITTFTATTSSKCLLRSSPSAPETPAALAAASGPSVAAAPTCMVVLVPPAAGAYLEGSSSLHVRRILPKAAPSPSAR